MFPDVTMNMTMNTTSAPQTSIGMQVIFVISLIVDVAGLIGNSFVILVIMKTKSLKSRLANQFIVNQSCIDLSSCFFLIGAVYRTGNPLDANNLGDRLYCQIWLSNSFVWSLVYCSTYALMALTLERYFSVVYPVWHKGFFNDTRSRIIMAATWIIGLVEGLLLSSLSSAIDPENGQCLTFVIWPSDTVRKLTGIWTVTLHYFLPMFILIFCYVRIILVITGRIKKVNPGQLENSENTQDKSWNKARFNVIYTLIIVGVLFAMCWSPNQIYYFMMNLGYPADFVSTWYNVTILTIYMNSSVNPFVYIIKYEQFKTAAAHLMGFKRASQEESSKTTTSTVTD